jgi:hypothetical protein
MDTLQDKLEYYTPAILLRFSKKEENNEDRVPEKQQTQEHATLEAQQKLLQQRDQKLETLSEEEQINLAIEESMKRSSFEVLPPTSPDQQQDQNNIADAAMSEEEQLRRAIEESLKIEEDRKKHQERHDQGLKNDKNKPVLY